MIRIVCLHIFFNLFLLTLPFLRLIMFGGSSEQVRKSSGWLMDTAGVYDLLPLGTASRACAHVAYIKINCDKASETSEEPQIASFLSVRGASEKRPWCVRGSYFLPNHRDRDIQLEHSWRKKLEKSNLRGRFKKCGTNAGRMLTFYTQKTAKKEKKNR